MRIVTLDFETLFGDDYTLSKMSTESYIRDPRFEAHGAAVKWQPDIPARWYDNRQLKYVLSQEDWSDVAILCHHTQFDGFILACHYGVRPKFWLDTLSMARLVFGNHLSVSLDSVRARFAIPAKHTPYQKFRNRHWSELDEATRTELADGCCDEVESIWRIFNLLLKDFPREELQIIDQTVRMFVEPELIGDINLLAKLWESENDRKAIRNAALGVDASELQSSDKFAALLAAERIEIDYKEGKNGPIPAFAKTDDFMRELLEHDNERVRALAEARLGVKSTLLQTRAATLGWMARRGALPVYIRFAGARTLRDSGGDGANWQNFKRGSDIRKAIQAPPGYLLAPIDASQIECRVLNFLAGQEDVTERFRRGEDPYIGIASAFYGRPITKADPLERGTGKQAELSCGYGCGDEKFQSTAKLGIYGPPVELSLAEAKRFVSIYRNTHPKVTRFWQDAELTLRKMAAGQEFDWSIFHIKNKRLYVEGRPLIYDTLEWHVPTTEEEMARPKDGPHWRVKTRNGWEKMYGAKLVQNVCEAVSRLIVFQAGLRIQAMGHRIKCRTHDELLVLIAKDGKQEYALESCMKEMRREPSWLPGIPLDCEGQLSERYAK